MKIKTNIKAGNMVQHDPRVAVDVRPLTARPGRKDEDQG